MLYFVNLSENFVVKALQFHLLCLNAIESCVSGFQEKEKKILDNVRKVSREPLCLRNLNPPPPHIFFILLAVNLQHNLKPSSSLR